VILVTGARGSVGRALVQWLDFLPVVGVDIEQMDVTNAGEVAEVMDDFRPELVLHLAGAKYAFDGEIDPQHVTAVNVTGTRNVLKAAERVGAKVVFSSTCKACDPETAYGASKLIAERMVLNAGGVVARFYNIRESDGNVFRLWEKIPVGEPIPYTDCWRYFMSMNEALDLLVAAMDLPCGRYVHEPGLPQHMSQVAKDLYPERELVEMPRRRGDRHKEPLAAACEQIWRIGPGPLCEVRSPYDFAQVTQAA